MTNLRNLSKLHVTSDNALSSTKSWENPQSCFSPLLSPPQPPDYRTPPNPRARLLIDFQHSSLPPRTNFHTQIRYVMLSNDIPQMYNNNITLGVWSGDLYTKCVSFNKLYTRDSVYFSQHSCSWMSLVKLSLSQVSEYITAYKAVEVYKIVLLSFKICYKRKIKEMT